MSAQKEPLSYAAMEKMLTGELLDRLKAEQQRYGKLETRIHKIRTICTIIDNMVDTLLSPRNGVRDGGQIIFDFAEEDMDALTWAVIEAKADSRELYDSYTAEVERAPSREVHS